MNVSKRNQRGNEKKERETSRHAYSVVLTLFMCVLYNLASYVYRLRVFGSYIIRIVSNDCRNF